MLHCRPTGSRHKAYVREMQLQSIWACPANCPLPCWHARASVPCILWYLAASLLNRLRNAAWIASMPWATVDSPHLPDLICMSATCLKSLLAHTAEGLPDAWSSQLGCPATIAMFKNIAVRCSAPCHAPELWRALLDHSKVGDYERGLCVKASCNGEFSASDACLLRHVVSGSGDLSLDRMTSLRCTSMPCGLMSLVQDAPFPSPDSNMPQTQKGYMGLQSRTARDSCTVENVPQQCTWGSRLPWQGQSLIGYHLPCNDLSDCSCTDHA